MRSFWGSFAGQLAGSLVPLLVVAIVAAVAWRRVFGGKSTAQAVDEAVKAAATIPGGVASLVGSKLRGETEKTYITSDQQRAQAEANLALSRGITTPWNSL